MMDEKQLAEVIKFVKANPEEFKEAEKWYKETDFLSKKDAWEESVVFNDWDKILFLVNNFFSEDYEEACSMLYLGIIYTNDIHPTDKIIGFALKKGKQALKDGKLKPLLANTAIEYSFPLPMTKWADIFGVSENKLRELRRKKKYNFDQVSPRKWRLPKHKIPAEYLEKYRQTAK